MKTGILVAIFVAAIFLVSGCAQKTSECRLSLCDCKCHAGEISEDSGMLCGINCLGEFGVSGCDSDCKETYDRETQAKQKCANVCTVTEDLSSGPCLSDNTEWNVPDWVCDVAHSPRTATDDLQENQCQAYINGEAHHFVEVDENCNLIKAV